MRNVSDLTPAVTNPTEAGYLFEPSPSAGPLKLYLILGSDAYVGVTLTFLLFEAKPSEKT